MHSLALWQQHLQQTADNDLFVKGFMDLFIVILSNSSYKLE